MPQPAHLPPFEVVLRPDDPYPVPPEGAFNGEDYLDGPDIARVAAAHIAQYPHLFDWLGAVLVVYRWKRAGGDTAGKAKLGECKKANGHDRFLLKRPVWFFVTLSADNCEGLRLTVEQMNALVFHELCHAGRTGKGQPFVYPHDFEGFKAELDEFGPWSADLQRAEDGFAAGIQARMQFDDRHPDDDEDDDAEEQE